MGAFFYACRMRRQPHPKSTTSIQGIDALLLSPFGAGCETGVE